MYMHLQYTHYHSLCCEAELNRSNMRLKMAAARQQPVCHTRRCICEKPETPITMNQR